MATNEIGTLTVSQCISSDYCRGWNDAVKEANKIIKRLENLLDDKCDKCICAERIQAYKRAHSEFNELMNRLIKEFEMREEW